MSAVDALAFLCLVAMVPILVLAGHGFVGGWQGWFLGAVLAFLAVGLWGQWMAEASVRRLELPTRLVVQLMMFATVTLYAAAGGLLVAGLVWFAVTAAAYVAKARQDA